MVRGEAPPRSVDREERAVCLAAAPRAPVPGLFARRGRDGAARRLRPDCSAAMAKRGGKPPGEARQRVRPPRRRRMRRSESDGARAPAPSTEVPGTDGQIPPQSTINERATPRRPSSEPIRL